MSKRSKLVFFGNERLATGVSTEAPTLRALVHAGYEVKAVVAAYNEGVSRSRRALEIIDVAHAYHIPVLLPDKPAEMLEKLKRYEAEAAVLVAYGKLVPQAVIDIFPKGIINIHPSLLPKLRGSTPVETAIFNNEAETGVSLMKLTAEMDAGPVYASKKITLAGTENKFELADLLLKEGCSLLMKHLEAILNGKLEPKTQDETEATYSRRLTKEMGLIDFKEPAVKVECKVRAFWGFPKARAKLHGHEVVITKARVAANQADGQLVIECQPGWLEILELIAPSGRSMSGADFLHGYKR